MSLQNRALAMCLAAAALSLGAIPAYAGPDKDNTTNFGYGLDLKQIPDESEVKLQGDFTASPASASLMKYALPAGNQGTVGSCVTWAIGYAGYGILMNEQKISGSPMAPMFLYSQIVSEYNGGSDSGTSAGIALKMTQQRGITTQKDWGAGTTNYQTLPTAAQKQNALNYKLAGFRNLMSYNDRKGAVKDAIAQGQPVPIGFRVRSSFSSLINGRTHYNPSPNEGVSLGHEVTIVAYDENGVTVQNSWGPNFGKNGFFTAPWSWVTGGDMLEMNAMTGVRSEFKPGPAPQPGPTAPKPWPTPTNDDLVRTSNAPTSQAPAPKPPTNAPRPPSKVVITKAETSKAPTATQPTSAPASPSDSTPATPNPSSSPSPGKPTDSPKIQDIYLENSDFESGADGWLGHRHAITTLGEQAQEGHVKAWLGGFGHSAVERLGQNVTLPQKSGKVTFEFWMKTQTDEKKQKAADRLAIQVFADNKYLETVAEFSNLDAGHDWVAKSVDLSKYAGKKIQVQFCITEDEQDQTSFFIDDLSIGTGDM